MEELEEAPRWLKFGVHAAIVDVHATGVASFETALPKARVPDRTASRRHEQGPRRARARTAEGPAVAFYVCVDGELVGSAGFMGPPTDGSAEIGYSIGQRYRRRGYATVAVALLAARAASAGVNRLIAHTRPANTASIEVLERNGFASAPGSQRKGHTLFVRDLV